MTAGITKVKGAPESCTVKKAFQDAGKAFCQLMEKVAQYASSLFSSLKERCVNAYNWAARKMGRVDEPKVEVIAPPPVAEKVRSLWNLWGVFG